MGRLRLLNPHHSNIEVAVMITNKEAVAIQGAVAIQEVKDDYLRRVGDMLSYEFEIVATVRTEPLDKTPYELGDIPF